MLRFIAEFLGHFHPVIVHLPIGILLLASLFYLLASTDRYQALRPAVSLSLLIGVISAVVACLTGWLLSTTGDYDPNAVGNHQWLGIATAVVAGISYACERKKVKYLSWVIAVLVLMITFTGHLGGSLTHGEGYLTEAFNNYSGSGESVATIENVQEAMVYDDVIRPILATKCYSCHGKRKQKGGLRLDEKDLILKGGEDGVVVVPGDAGRSELVQRIYLAHENEDHMPPKEKPQPTGAQRDLIKWWIVSGAPFDKKVRDLDQAPDLRYALASLGKAGDDSNFSSIPNAHVGEAPADVLSLLSRRGVVIVPVAQDSHYLSVNLVNADSSNDSVMLALPSLEKQLVWLKTGTYPIDGEGLNAIGQLTNLTRLQIGNLKNPGPELQHLAKLKNLQYLNMTGSVLTKEDVSALKKLTSLRNLYLFRCGISAGDYSDLSKSLPGAQIDTGAYVVATLASDTIEVTAARK